MEILIEVNVWSNDGDKVVATANDVSHAEAIVREACISSNHMIRVDVNGKKHQRWDRERFVGENNWREVDPHSLMVIGKIREIMRG